MFKVSSSSDSFSHRSTSSSRAFFVDVYSVTNSMSDAFSGFISRSSNSFSLRSISLILRSDSSTARSAFRNIFCCSLRSA